MRDQDGHAPEEAVRLEREDAVARVVLNRPGQRNAVDLATCQGLRAAFEKIDADPQVRLVLIAAQGPVFCAGADLKERKGRDAAWVRRRRLAAFAAYDAIEACTRPVVALVQGAVVGSGGEIAMAADFILAEEGTFFRFPEPRWGTVGATQRLQRAVGVRCAKELLFTGRDLHLDEAERRGLVARRVATGGLPEAARDVAAAILAAPATAIRLTKQAVDLGGRTDLATGIRIELAAIDQMLDGEEWREGVEKFNSS